MASLTLLTLPASACGALGGDGGEARRGTTVRVEQAVVATDLNEQQQAAGLVARAFPTTVGRLHAVLALTGAAPGDVVVGRWYQLSVAGGLPDGTLVSETRVELAPTDVAPDGRAQLALRIDTNGGRLPEGDWLLRLHVNDASVRTMGFVITSQLDGLARNSGAGEGQPYVVQEGDSFRSIAERFKGQNETVEGYVQRLVELNGIRGGSVLVLGQTLLLPAALP